MALNLRVSVSLVDRVRQMTSKGHWVSSLNHSNNLQWMTMISPKLNQIGSCRDNVMDFRKLWQRFTFHLFPLKLILDEICVHQWNLQHIKSALVYFHPFHFCPNSIDGIMERRLPGKVFPFSSWTSGIPDASELRFAQLAEEYIKSRLAKFLIFVCLFSMCANRLPTCF